MQQMNIFSPENREGCEVEHHFSHLLYAKQVTIPAGIKLVQHVHSFDHLSILAEGRALVSFGTTTQEFIGPVALNIVAGVQHSVEALTPCTWFCIHSTEETDPDKIDHSLISQEN